MLDFNPNGATQDYPVSATGTLLIHESQPGHHLQVCALVGAKGRFLIRGPRREERRGAEEEREKENEKEGGVSIRFSSSSARH